jgi:AraC-like DNA-binding protein
MRWFVLRFGILPAEGWIGFYSVSCAGFFLLAPVLYLYVRALCFEDFRLRRVHLVHLVPFVAIAALGVVRTVLIGTDFSTGSIALDRFLVFRFWTIFWFANLVQIPFYIVAMFGAVRRYRRRLNDLHSSTECIDLGWLVALLSLISLHWVFVSSRSTLALFDIQVPRLIATLDLFSITIFLVFTTVLVIKGLAHVKVFPGIEEAAHANGSSLSTAELERCAERLVGCMEADKPHLDPSLSVDELALKLGVPSWQLSRVLNTAFRQNFFNFVNSHRVEEAKRQLEDPALNARTMLRILHESGFNSKSTFNDAFKRHTGMTPSEYRRRSQRSAA